MILHIRHSLTYRYSRPVFLEPMTVRLRPRVDGTQNLLAFEMRIDPQPVGQTETLDLHGNVARVMWFDGMLDSLSLRAESRVQTILTNPFNYLITDPGVLKLPAKYAADDAQLLGLYLRRPHSDRSVDDLAAEVLREVDGKCSDFLTRLTSKIHRRCATITRPLGDAWAPARTLRERQGACRDLAVLFIDACRSVGLAARFVSGYKYDSSADDQRELHAWAGVYLPGAGWRGYDPSLGMATADEHTSVAAAADPVHAAPTDGRFRGDATSTLDFEIDIQIERDTSTPIGGP